MEKWSIWKIRMQKDWRLIQDDGMITDIKQARYREIFAVSGSLDFITDDVYFVYWKID